ncbi:MAG: radical SAM family heme chaperone HemW [Chthoniobacterales bacterium]|nr:radical SAM family heme chaperone HemW [Chthoniobacterales bacterium]
MCPYCSFYKEASDRNKTQAFLDAILLEADQSGEGLRPETIFFGGGTPTALSTLQLDFLISGLRARLDFSELREFTIEMNPATVSREKAAALLERGVNRVSMGVQSWDDALLKTLGRVHSASQARRSYHILREAGCRNVNLDLIFGVPGQSVALWRESLLRTLELAPDHISAYCLTYEEDTEYFERFRSGEFVPEEARDAEFFEVTMDVLSAAGFEQYEISNHAKPGRECLHNLAYWNGADYAGFGPSAFSTQAGLRRRNIADTAEYIRRIQGGLARHDFEESVPDGLRASEVVAFGLRTKQGISPEGIDPKVVSALTANGYLEASPDRLKLTRKGKLVADAVAAELL